LCSMLS
jgi:hypothetical protein